MSKLFKVGTRAKGSQASTVTGNLNHAGVTVDSDILNGFAALYEKLPSVIEENTPTIPEKMVDMHEGKGL